MELPPVAQDAPPGATAAGRSAEAALTTDFETFLTLLTAQMRYQDPLNPTESTEFVAQLASFSALEQQIETNETLTDIAGLLAVESDLASLGAWIGQEVRVSGAIGYGGEPLTLETLPDPGAEAATLVVTDAFGTPLARIPVPPEAERIVWDGRIAGGATAPDGVYGFTVEYSDGFSVTSRVAATAWVPVTEVRLEDGAAVLVTEGGATLPADAATAIRAAKV